VVSGTFCEKYHVVKAMPMRRSKMTVMLAEIL